MTNCLCPVGSLRQVIEAVPTAMILISENGRTVMMNAPGEREFGYQENEILGWRIDRLVLDRSAGLATAAKPAAAIVPKPIGLDPGRDL